MASKDKDWQDLLNLYGIGLEKGEVDMLTGEVHVSKPASLDNLTEYLSLDTSKQVRELLSFLPGSAGRELNYEEKMALIIAKDLIADEIDVGDDWLDNLLLS